MNAFVDADLTEVFETTISDLDRGKFEHYFYKELGTTIEEKGISYEIALKAKRVVKNEHLTLAGLLFFGFEPQNQKPAFCVKAVSFVGNDLAGTLYRDSRDIVGTIPDMFEKSLAFLALNLHFIQKDQNFNSLGILELSRIALEEIIQNALLHRDYFKNAPIRILIFDNRIEIISPGRLPNSLTVEEIKYGNMVIRNNLLVGFGTRLMPYRGLGSVIIRALKEQPDIEFVNDIEGEKFTAIFPRPQDNR